eukprot:SAG22_NODE_16769_length_318_cov_0.858447_1_plen_58_part_01
MFLPWFCYVFTFFRCVLGPYILAVLAQQIYRGEAVIATPAVFGVLQVVAVIATILVSF